MQKNASADGRKVCRVCEQPLDLGQVAYCSCVCRGLARGTSHIEEGSYWGITAKNERKEVEACLKRNY